MKHEGSVLYRLYSTIGFFVHRFYTKLSRVAAVSLRIKERDDDIAAEGRGGMDSTLITMGTLSIWAIYTFRRTTTVGGIEILRTTTRVLARQTI